MRKKINRKKKVPKILEICPFCFPGAQFIGRIVPGYSLIKNSKGLCIINEHDVVYRFQKTPMPDPYRGMTDKQINSCSDEIESEYSKFARTQEKEPFLFNLTSACDLYQDCVDSGMYSRERDGRNFDYWIFSRCGELLEQFESKEKAHEKVRMHQ